MKRLSFCVMVVVAISCGSSGSGGGTGGGSSGAGGGSAGTGGGTAGVGGGTGTGGGSTGSDGGLAVGSGCDASTDCQFAPGDTIHQYTPECLMNGFPGGYCALPAHDGYGCWPGMGSTVNRQCLKACTGDTDCRQAEGYVCCNAAYPGDAGGLCLPSPCG
jgi:hypothetical protein